MFFTVKSIVVNSSAVPSSSHTNKSVGVVVVGLMLTIKLNVVIAVHPVKLLVTVAVMVSKPGIELASGFGNGLDKGLPLPSKYETVTSVCVSMISDSTVEVSKRSKPSSSQPPIFIKSGIVFAIGLGFTIKSNVLVDWHPVIVLVRVAVIVSVNKTVFVKGFGSGLDNVTLLPSTYVIAISVCPPSNAASTPEVSKDSDIPSLVLAPSSQASNAATGFIIGRGSTMIIKLVVEKQSANRLFSTRTNISSIFTSTFVYVSGFIIGAVFVSASPCDV